MSAVLLYLVSAPIIFIFIGLCLYLIAFIWIAINNLSGSDAASYPFLVIYFLYYIGIPFSLLFSLFIPPFVLRWISSGRTRR